MAKRGRGRPTKYKGDVATARVEAIIEKLDMKTFLKFCGVEHIANELGVCRDTVYEWQKQHPEFSDTIKRWESARNALFYALMVGRQMAPAIWIFLAKNWLGLSDKNETELSIDGRLEHKHTISLNSLKKSYEHASRKNKK